MKNAKKMKGAGKTKSTAVAAVIFGSLFALGGTTFVTPAAANMGSGHSVSAEAGKQLQQATAQELHEQFMALPEVQEALAAQNDDQLKASSQAFPIGLASLFGKAFLRGIFTGAGNAAFSEALRVNGYDPNNVADVARALADIQADLDELMKQNDEILNEIEDLIGEMQMREFRDRNAPVVAATTAIKRQVQTLSQWAEDGTPVEQSTITGAVEALSAQIIALEGAAGDIQSGAIYALMHADNHNVSDTEDFWQAVDAYRDQVRVVLAQGMSGLELIVEHWDHPTGEYHAQVKTARMSVEETAQKMYDFGVSVPGPDDQRFVQYKNGMALTKGLEDVSANISEKDSWVWTSKVVNQTHGDNWNVSLEEWLQNVANSYSPENHGGQTLEDFFKDRDIPTSFVYSDTWGFKETTVRQPKSTRVDVFYTPEVSLGQIVGNTYEQKKITVGERVSAGYQRVGIEFCGDYVPCWNADGTGDHRAEAEGEIRSENEKWRLAALGAGAYVDQWQDYSERHDDAQGRVTVSKDDDNIGEGGLLTDSREDSIEDALYGTNE